jgi:uncharacterized membrane protein YsdA (DUF1294 family)
MNELEIASHIFGGLVGYYYAAKLTNSKEFKEYFREVLQTPMTVSVTGMMALTGAVYGKEITTLTIVSAPVLIYNYFNK